MSYNITDNRVPSEVLADLPRRVDDAKKNAPVDEHPLIELAGQVIHYNVEGLTDDQVVDVSAYGSNIPSTGTKTFSVSVNAKPIRTPASKAVAAEPWTPRQGPLGAVASTPLSADTAAKLNSASSSPVPVTATPATPATPATGKGRSG